MTQNSIDLSQVQAAALFHELNKRDGFQVLRKAVPRKQFNDLGDEPVFPVLVLDTETTGLEFNCETIEIGALLVEMGAVTHKLGKVLGAYQGFEQPSKPISPEITAINGITNEMVAGSKFDEEAFLNLYRRSCMVVAHNSSFDRPNLERRFPKIQDIKAPWVCSIRDLEWTKRGYASNKLEVLALQSGFFYKPHRALDDVVALLYVLGTPMKGEESIMPLSVLEKSMELTQYQVAAVNSPFEKKDLLKARGYIWKTDDKIWVREFSGRSEDLQAEQAFLAEQIYERVGAKFELGMKGPHSRYSSADFGLQLVDVFDESHPHPSQQSANAPAA